jgi:hypothetical protein
MGWQLTFRLCDYPAGFFPFLPMIQGTGEHVKHQCKNIQIVKEGLSELYDRIYLNKKRAINLVFLGK